MIITYIKYWLKFRREYKLLVREYVNLKLENQLLKEIITSAGVLLRIGS